MSMRGWWIAVTIGAAAAALLIPADRLLLTAAQEASPAWLVGCLRLGTWLGYGAIDIGIPVALGLAAWRRGERTGLRRGLAGGAAVAAAGLLDQLLKNLLCRARPSAAAAGAFLVGFPCAPAPYALASFPSGHATTAFALAALLALWYPRWRWASLAIAGLVGLSRIVLGSHFPADVVAGAALGAAVVLAATRRWPGAFGVRGEEGER
jgi:undecaprenyl-diphosphatase